MPYEPEIWADPPIGRLRGMLEVVEDMYLPAGSLSRNNVVTLRHVSRLVHLAIMIDLLVNHDLVSPIMQGLVVLLVDLSLVHRHLKLVYLNLIEFALLGTGAMCPQQKLLIRILFLHGRAKGLKIANLHIP